MQFTTTTLDPDTCKALLDQHANEGGTTTVAERAVARRNNAMIRRAPSYADYPGFVLHSCQPIVFYDQPRADGIIAYGAETLLLISNLPADAGPYPVQIGRLHHAIDTERCTVKILPRPNIRPDGGRGISAGYRGIELENAYFRLGQPACRFDQSLCRPIFTIMTHDKKLKQVPQLDRLKRPPAQPGGATASGILRPPAMVPVIDSRVPCVTMTEFQAWLANDAGFDDRFNHLMAAAAAARDAATSSRFFKDVPMSLLAYPFWLGRTRFPALGLWLETAMLYQDQGVTTHVPGTVVSPIDRVRSDLLLTHGTRHGGLATAPLADWARAVRMDRACAVWPHANRMVQLLNAYINEETRAELEYSR